jgi:hypothetical protein
LPANAEIEYLLAQIHARAGHRERAIELARRGLTARTAAPPAKP